MRANAPTEENWRLREIANRIGVDRVLARQSWDIWDWIAVNAGAINASAVGGLALGAFQQMALNETIATICRMFDDYEHAEVGSVKYAIKAIRESKLYNRRVFCDYLVGLGFPKRTAALCEQQLPDADLIDKAVTFLERIRPTENNNIGLKRLKAIRHGRLSHAALTKEQLTLNEADVHFCYEWSTEFLGMLAHAFNVGMVESDSKSAKTALARLCLEAKIVKGPLFSLL